jgi:hypothetical protein
MNGPAGDVVFLEHLVARAREFGNNERPLWVHLYCAPRGRTEKPGRQDGG